MLRLGLAVVCVSVLILLGRCDVEQENNVFVLTAANFDGFIKKNALALVEFYAPWCGHCQKLEPEYAKAAAKLKKDGKVVLAKLDATVHGDIANRYNVGGYPTLKFFRNGEPVDYSGGRTSDTIVQWVENMTGPATVTMTEDEAKSHEKGVLYIARLSNKQGKVNDIYTAIADKMRMVATFGVIIAEGAKDEVTVYHPSEESITTAIGTDMIAFEKWVEEHKFPILGPIDGETYAAYESRGLEFVWFAASVDDYKKVGVEVREGAKSFRSDYSFVWLDTNKFGDHLERELGITTLPGLVLRAKESGRYVFPKDKQIVRGEIIQFFKDIKAGKIEKSLKSEPIPATNDEAVKVVVGGNFEEIVFSDKDVMLEVYAPWCGHCKQLEPIYKELAEKVSTMQHIVIAKMDGTANEPPTSDFVIQGFPTIFWVPAGSKTPIAFNEARSLKGFLGFIKKHSTKPFTVEVADDKSTDDSEGKDEL